MKTNYMNEVDLLLLLINKVAKIVLDKIYLETSCLHPASVLFKAGKDGGCIPSLTHAAA